MIQRFLQNVAELQRAIGRAQKEDVSLAEQRQGLVTDFKAKQKEAKRMVIITAISAVKNAAQGIRDLRLQQLISELDQTQDLNELKQKADKILELGTEAESSPSNAIAKPPKVPFEISDDVLADYNEMMKCYDAGAYRSAVILCGRILETVLHRKYFEVTNNDLLEKSPGIGLGNLVAKLSEKNVAIDPALGNQIHLINQVRVHSVHHKKQAFMPSQQQAQAIILYTLDIVEKLFI